MNFPNIDPVIFNLGPIAVRWYGIAYMAGIVLGWLQAKHALKDQPELALKFDDMLTWIVLGIVAGGRLGHVLFYAPAHYLSYPLEILMVWKGGMSFHGGVIGVAAAVWLFSYKRNINFWNLIDVVALVTPIGLCFGRIANFINAELYGRITDVPWGIVFPTGGPYPRHPSQLYEAVLEGICLWVLLVLRWNRNRLSQGRTAAEFLIGYGLARIISEVFREPQIILGTDYLTYGQLLSLPMIVLGVVLWNRAQPQNLFNK